MNALGGETGERPVESLEQSFTGENLLVLLGRDGIHQVDWLVRRIVEAVDDLIDGSLLDACCRQAVLDCGIRKASGVLLSAESLLGGRGDDVSIHDQGRRRIVSLRDPVFPLLETGPVRLLERNGVFKSANS